MDAMLVEIVNLMSYSRNILLLATISSIAICASCNDLYRDSRNGSVPGDDGYAFLDGNSNAESDANHDGDETSANDKIAAKDGLVSGMKLWINPNLNPVKKYNAASGNERALLGLMAKHSIATWLTSGDVSWVGSILGSANSQNAVPVLVAYYINNRDCGSYSSGGAANENAYRGWVRRLAQQIGSRRAIVILEPDALAMSDKKSCGGQSARLNLLRDAVGILKNNSSAIVYIDAGAYNWPGPGRPPNGLPTLVSILPMDSLSMSPIMPGQGI